MRLHAFYGRSCRACFSHVTNLDLLRRHLLSISFCRILLNLHSVTGLKFHFYGTRRNSQGTFNLHEPSDRMTIVYICLRFVVRFAMSHAPFRPRGSLMFLPVSFSFVILSKYAVAIEVLRAGQIGDKGIVGRRGEGRRKRDRKEEGNSGARKGL